jgi:hypothetical protein
MDRHALPQRGGVFPVPPHLLNPEKRRQAVGKPTPPEGSKALQIHHHFIEKALLVILPDVKDILVLSQG